jgi:hypothetical protein
MRKALISFAVAGIGLLSCGIMSLAQVAKPAPDFKLNVAFFSTALQAIGTAEMIAHEGRVIQISSDSKELLLFDPVEKQVELLDLDREVIAKITYKRLDDEMASLRRTLTAKADLLAQKTKRAPRIAASKGRDLYDPKFTDTFDQAKHSLRLTNPTVEVDVVGEPEPNAARLAVITEVLNAIVKLGTLRNPGNIPPFSRLDAIKALSETHHLRPVEFSFLFRLAGEPVRYRWTYKLETKINDEDRQLFVKIDEFRKKAKLIVFDDFDKPELDR